MIEIGDEVGPGVDTVWTKDGRQFRCATVVVEEIQPEDARWREVPA